MAGVTAHSALISYASSLLSIDPAQQQQHHWELVRNSNT